MTNNNNSVNKLVGVLFEAKYILQEDIKGYQIKVFAGLTYSGYGIILVLSQIVLTGCVPWGC